MKQVDIIGIGSAFIDYFFEVDEQFLKTIDLKPQGSRAISNEEFSDIFSSEEILAKSSGGSTSITLAVLQKLGIDTEYYGTIGKDDDGVFWEKGLPGINKQLIFLGNTPRSACLLSNNRKDRSFLYTLNEKENVFFEKVDYTYINTGKYLHITPFYTDYNNSFNYLVNLVSEITGPKISFCPALVYASLGIEKLKPLLQKTEIVFFSKEELLLLYSDVKKGSKALLELGPTIVVCTLGEEGVLVTTKEKQLIIKGKRARKVVDTTGAGDAFAAGFLYGIVENKSLEWSANFANAIAAEAITDFGLNWLKNFRKETLLKSF